MVGLIVLGFYAASGAAFWWLVQHAEEMNDEAL